MQTKSFTNGSPADTAAQPQIAADRCTGCARCVDICPTQALAQVAGKAVLYYPDRCTYCTVCEDVCPTHAIALPFLIVFADSHHTSAGSRNSSFIRS